MGRKKPERSMGPIIAANLARLGYGRTVVNSAEVAKLIAQRTGKAISRQRVAQIVNAVNVTQATIKMLADGLGVDPSELTKD